MFRKIQLQSGPLGGRIALVLTLKPEVRFRISDSDGSERVVVYRATTQDSMHYVFEKYEAIEPATEMLPSAEVV